MSFQEPIHIFNPLVNTYRFPTEATFADLKWFFQRLFTWENIHNFPALLSSHYAVESMNPSYWTRYIDTQGLILPHIPDDKLWLLGFTMFYEKYYDDLIVYYYKPTVLGNTTNGHYIAGGYESITINANDVPGQIHKLLEKLDAIEAYFTNHSTARINPKKFLLSNPGDFLTNLLCMVVGKEYAYHPDNSYEPRWTVTQVERALLDNTNNALSFQSLTNFQVTLTKVVTEANRSALYTTLQYTANPMRYLPSPRIAKKEHNPVLYGVELEVATDYEVRDLIDAQKELFFIAKHDGSITGTGRTKVELVTVPMSLRAHKRDWAHWFKKLDYTRFDCTTQTNNGQHVHVSKDAFLNDRHRDNFIWFFTSPCHNEFITAMSERTKASMDSFSPLPRYPAAASLVNCYRNIHRYASNLRGTINLNSRKPTIEVRLFRGIVSYASMLKNLEFVDAVFHFTQDRSFRQVTLREFLTWLNALPRNRYKVLRKYFGIMPKVVEHVAAASLAQLTYGVTDPNKVVLIVNKSGLPLSTAVATLLNKGKKRTYVFDKKTGQLRLDDSTKSKVAFLDRKLEAIYTREKVAAAS